MPKKKLGDMPAEEFRKFGYQMIDWVADYLENMEEYPVMPRVAPGDLRSQLPSQAPESGEPMEAIFEDFKNLVLPGVTHWNHPSFFAYFSVSGSGPGILGELLAATLNINGMLWKSCPASTELEEVCLAWLREWLRLPDRFQGVIYDTASISTFHALAAAREAIAGMNIRELGMARPEGMPQLKLYTSEQSHSSVEKSAIALGLGQQSVSKIGVDREFRMDPTDLQKQIERDLEHGQVPFCVVATVGTTSTTSIDPVPEISRICDRHSLWLHVDAAYAGPAVMVPGKEAILEGCERASSLVTNPHKWLFTPIDLSVLYCRRPELLRQAFTLVPDYLKSEEEATNFMDYGIQLGRRFRALKLWMVMRYFGRRGFVDRLEQQMAWAGEFAAWVDEDPEFQRMAETPFSTICFRATPDLGSATSEQHWEKFNRRLMERINADGHLMISDTRLNGKRTLRLAIGNVKTERRHVVAAWGHLRETLQRLKTDLKNGMLAL